MYKHTIKDKNIYNKYQKLINNDVEALVRLDRCAVVEPGKMIR
jgi:hypothetical protein